MCEAPPPPGSHCTMGACPCSCLVYEGRWKSVPLTLLLGAMCGIVQVLPNRGLSGVIDPVAAVSLCQWAVLPPHLKILRFSDCLPNTLEHFSLAPYFNTSTCTIVNIHSRRGYNVKSPIMSNRPYLKMSGRSNIVKSPPNPGIAHGGRGGVYRVALISANNMMVWG